MLGWMKLRYCSKAGLSGQRSGNPGELRLRKAAVFVPVKSSNVVWLVPGLKDSDIWL